MNNDKMVSVPFKALRDFLEHSACTYKGPEWTKNKAALRHAMSQAEQPGDVIREMNDELADLRARLAERDALLKDAKTLISIYRDNLEDEAAELEDIAIAEQVLREISALSASAKPSAPVERKRHIPRTNEVYDASWTSEKLPATKCMDAIRPIDPGKEIIAIVESSLSRSFKLGQLYWQQADSDSTCQQNKSDQTMEVQSQHILNVVKSIKELTQ